MQYSTRRPLVVRLPVAEPVTLEVEQRLVQGLLAEPVDELVDLPEPQKAVGSLEHPDARRSPRALREPLEQDGEGIGLLDGVHTPTVLIPGCSHPSRAETAAGLRSRQDRP